jgi:hypothetical protein
MMSLQKLIPNIVATLICWLTIGLVVMVTSPGAFIRDVVIVIAVLTTVTLWGTWAGSYYMSGNTAAASSEKAKRRAGTDAHTALLLELLDEDERREVKERLIERLQADGETSSLSDLLGEQDAQAKQHH